MLNDLLIRELAQSRINDLHRAAEASRLARLARGRRRGDQMATLRQVFASLRRGATWIPRQRSSSESRSAVTARPKSRPTTQCC